MCHGALLCQKNALLIRPSADQCLLHLPEQALLLPQILFHVHDSCDSTHIP